MFELIWGDKSSALFDIWSLEHFLSGISISAILIYFNKDKSTKNILIQLLLVAYAWETVEHYLETGVAGESVTYWFHGVEFWANRIITDPLMMVLGYYTLKSFEFVKTPARIASLTFIGVHLFVFPHSMYLHELLQ